MSSHILKCLNSHYTLSQICPTCNEKAEEPKPPKFSPEDKYGKYRREVKKQEWQKKGLY